MGIAEPGRIQSWMANATVGQSPIDSPVAAACDAYHCKGFRDGGFAKEAKVSKVAIQALVALRYQPSQLTCIRIPHSAGPAGRDGKVLFALLVPYHIAGEGGLRCDGCIGVSNEKGKREKSPFFFGNQS